MNNNLMYVLVDKETNEFNGLFKSLDDFYKWFKQEYEDENAFYQDTWEIQKTTKKEFIKKFPNDLLEYNLTNGEYQTIRIYAKNF